jgi:hypothetical protein
MKVALQTLMLGFGLALSVPAFAQGDSSADAAGFARTVEGSDAVIVRVPIDAQGRELSSAAELRVYTGADMSTSADGLAAAFDRAVDASAQPQVDIDADSSTSWGSSCNYGWNRYSYGSGWNYGSYYSSYTPTYYYGYNTSYYNSYSYNYSCYYDSYRPTSSYRYYYYNRCW